MSLAGLISVVEQITATSIGVTLGVTLVLGGGCAWMTGRALALNWRPQWQLLVYAMLLGFADRFLVFALFGGDLVSLSGYVADTALLVLIAFAAFHIARARQMVRQYPWEFRRAWLLFYRSSR
tara:strand:- start:205690 stop:206058 length:369 start_codon:yes stop_codon:yes gene_type:complete